VDDEILSTDRETVLPQVEDTTIFRNVGNFLPIDTAFIPEDSYLRTALREPETSYITDIFREGGGGLSPPLHKW
jgi:hypothetical protein